jgi:hypothetical protein
MLSAMGWQGLLRDRVGGVVRFEALHAVAVVKMLTVEGEFLPDYLTPPVARSVRGTFRQANSWRW